MTNVAGSVGVTFTSRLLITRAHRTSKLAPQFPERSCWEEEPPGLLEAFQHHQFVTR
jgi:hypothetical protein